MIVEDDRVNWKLLTLTLEKFGLQVELAEDGNIGMEKIIDKQFDMIFMDMLMPGMDGFEVTRRVRAQGIKTPIIATTALAMTGDRKKCLEAGCDAYLEKPINRSNLLDILRQWLNKPVETVSV